MATDLAPIGVSTYIRLPHLQRTISALQKNALAEQSELFVFSDAPIPGDEEQVAAVRSYLQTVDGFKEVHAGGGALGSVSREGLDDEGIQRWRDISNERRWLWRRS